MQLLLDKALSTLPKYEMLERYIKTSILSIQADHHRYLNNSKFKRRYQDKKMRKIVGSILLLFCLVLVSQVFENITIIYYQFLSQSFHRQVQLLQWMTATLMTLSVKKVQLIILHSYCMHIYLYTHVSALTKFHHVAV